MRIVAIYAGKKLIGNQKRQSRTMGDRGNRNAHGNWA
jgi:hypothetical protein